MIRVRINGVSAEVYGLCVKERPKIPAPKRKVKEIEIPGRDGSLTKLENYQDITITIPFNALEEEKNMKDLAVKARSYFYDAKTLRISDDPGYYKVKTTEISEMENPVTPYLNFEVSFRCDPFIYLDSEMETYEDGDVIYNPGTYLSKPKLRVHFSDSSDGFVRIETGKEQRFMEIHEPDPSETYIIDCDLMDTYAEQGLLNRNSHISGAYFRLSVGKHIIHYGGSVESVEIDGRWRYR